MPARTVTDMVAEDRGEGRRVLGAPPRRDRLGWLLLALSVAALPFVRLALRRLGRLGGLLVEGGVGILLVRAIAMVCSGALRRLRLLPRLLLVLELVVDGVAVGTGFLVWAWRPVTDRGVLARTNDARTGEHDATGAHPGAPLRSPPWLARVSGAAAGAAFVLHTIRMAIYLSPGRGLREGSGDYARRS